MVRGFFLIADYSDLALTGGLSINILLNNFPNSTMAPTAKEVILAKRDYASKYNKAYSIDY